MKTLILNGSPHSHGDTGALIGRLMELLEGECGVVDAYEANISPCGDCRCCRLEPGCAVRDGMDQVYAQIRESDNIVIASPIYFSELTGRLLDVASRLQTYYSARRFRGEEPLPGVRRGGVILVGGGDGNMEKAADTARTLLKHMNCKDVFPAVCSHGTDLRPADQDPRARKNIVELAAFLNGGAMPRPVRRRLWPEI